jgi:membrane-bound ClpP family serine protease
MDLFSFINNIGIIQALCLLVGLGLVIFEMFDPGFGVPGISGLALLALGVILTAKSLFEALVMVIILMAILGLMLALAIRSATRGRLSRTMVLSTSLNKESGFNSTDDFSSYLGREGVAETTLRPSGTAVFDDIKLGVVTEGGFIQKDSPVKVVQVSGGRIVVREIK